MKRSLTYLATLGVLFNLIPVKDAQAAAVDSAAFADGLHRIAGARTEKDYVDAAAYFERLPEADLPWLNKYYAALCYIQASYKAAADKQKDALLDKAQPLIDKAFQLNPKEAELFILQAFLYQSRIQVNPTMRGMSYSSKADASLKKATAIDDANPRAWSLMGYNVFHTPAAFGGGPQKALPVFQKAAAKFAAFKPMNPWMPTWGEPENRNMVAECRKAIQ
jgi:tetratricopeptide (TPR) repeat protein